MPWLVVGADRPTEVFELSCLFTLQGLEFRVESWGLPDTTKAHMGEP